MKESMLTESLVLTNESTSMVSVAPSAFLLRAMLKGLGWEVLRVVVVLQC
jgi:hypothetical protein